MGGEILVKRGSESEIDRGNVAAKCNKQARQAPQGRRQSIARRYATERAVNAMGIVVVLVFVQLARQVRGIPKVAAINLSP